jgi:hypothetical protein
MSYDIGKTPEGYKAIGGKRENMSGIFIGIVMGVADATQHMGRLKVWVPEFGGSPTNPKYWYTVGYASPFAGATPVKENTEGEGTTQQAYGFWMVPPDIGNEVLVCFVNGDTARGYWFACLYQQNMNQMVPAVGSAKTTGGVEPAMEYNKKDPSVNLADPVRQRFAPLADGLKTQGLDTDPRRGASTTSARRDDISRAFGFVTPRGNSIHIDDGELSGGEPDNEFIRLRTRSGVGITIHETDGFVFIVSKNGKSYVEVSDNGINFFTEQPMNMRTTGDYNIQSTGDINIDAGGDLNIFATGKIAMGAGGDTHVSAVGNLLLGSGGNSSIKSGGTLLLTSTGDMGLGAGGKSIRNGTSIIDGVPPPIAPKPIPPERHPMPDGAGGMGTGSSIGSYMPHHQPYDPGFEKTEEYILATGLVEIPKAQRARAKLLYDKLKKRGWSDVQIAAIIGSFMQESSLDPSKHQIGGNGLGLAQWDDRRNALLAYARSKNRPWDDYDLQLDFMDHELATTEKTANRMLKAATTLPEAMAAMKKYERYGVRGRRDQYAQVVLKQIGDKTFV